MKTNKPINEVEESSYSMLVHSEEKRREYFEVLLYGLILLGAIAAILQFAEQPDPLPLSAMPDSGFVQPA